jgi:predicted TIM-barrel fold metal-dependent hydrolase
MNPARAGVDAELTMVLDHLSGPPVGSGQDGEDGPSVAVIRRLAALPNVTCKLSGAPNLSRRQRPAPPC